MKKRMDYEEGRIRLKWMAVVLLELGRKRPGCGNRFHAFRGHLVFQPPQSPRKAGTGLPCRFVSLAPPCGLPNSGPFSSSPCSVGRPLLASKTIPLAQVAIAVSSGSHAPLRQQLPKTPGFGTRILNQQDSPARPNRPIEVKRSHLCTGEEHFSFSSADDFGRAFFSAEQVQQPEELV